MPIDRTGCEEAPGTCAFCGHEGLAVDDIGEFYLWPDPEIQEGRACCWSCFDGEPGQKHKARYGVGDR